jgi:hypothetical protein
MNPFVQEVSVNCIVAKGYFGGLSILSLVFAIFMVAVGLVEVLTASHGQFDLGPGRRAVAKSRKSEIRFISPDKAGTPPTVMGTRRIDLFIICLSRIYLDNMSTKQVSHTWSQRERRLELFTTITSNAISHIGRRTDQYVRGFIQSMCV